MSNLVTLLLFNAGLLYAQHTAPINGVVTERSDRPLGYATVRVFGSNGPILTIASDSLGRFEITSLAKIDSGAYLIAYYLKSRSRPYMLAPSIGHIHLVIDSVSAELNEVKLRPLSSDSPEGRPVPPHTWRCFSQGQ